MSRSLLFECWREDEPAATDPLERKSWAALRIFVEGRCVTRFWNRRTAGESETIYVPTFPIARWIVGNWWQLFHEPCRAESPPQERSRWSAAEHRWVRRHCLRAAESGLFLPYLHIYSNGPAVTLAWFADDSQAFSSMPGHFLYPGISELDTRDAMDCMGEFVSKVLAWCADVDDHRVECLRVDWAAIKNADTDERAFCRTAGRMGLDPYAVADWPQDDLVELLTTDLGHRIDEVVVEDLFEATEPELAAQTWKWVRGIEATYRLRPNERTIIDAESRHRTAKDQGYSVAQEVRSSVGLANDASVDDVATVSSRIVDAQVSFVHHNHVPGRAIQATVGWRDGKEPVITGPAANRPDNQRFMDARGLYLALVGCQRGPRLVTRAHTWDQQASRAFAAELLAPQSALVEDASPDMEPDERRELQDELAVRYGVSTEVIRLQLQNAGVWRDSA